MRIWIRNLTKGKDFSLNLPMTETELDNVLNPNDEYIIIESDVLDVGEYDGIDELNKFLIECEENGVDEETLMILSEILLYHEVIEAVRNGSYQVIDFDIETANWSSSSIASDFDKGMVVFDNGFNPFDFEMTEDIYDWINWESVWINAHCQGWQAVTIRKNNGYLNSYLVHR